MTAKKLSIVAISFVAFASLTVATVPAQVVWSAEDTTVSTGNIITIPITKHLGGEEGKEYELAEKTGVTNAEYKVKVISKNQGSVHPNSDIIVRSGSTSVVVKDVESEPYVSKAGEGTLVVADGTVRVFVKLGADEGFSGGVDVQLSAVQKPVPVQPTNPAPTPVTPAPAAPAPAAPAPAAQPAAELPAAGPASATLGLLAAAATAAGTAAHHVFRRIRG